MLNRCSKILRTKMVVSIASHIMCFASFCFVHQLFFVLTWAYYTILSRNVPPVLFLFQIFFNNCLHSRPVIPFPRPLPWYTRPFSFRSTVDGDHRAVPDPNLGGCCHGKEDNLKETYRFNLKMLIQVNRKIPSNMYIHYRQVVF